MAQPVVDSVLNPASYALPGMPNHGVAQGGLFVAFGRNLGPTGFNQVTAFPLQKTLNGISIKVTVAGTTVDCLPMNSYGASPALATQVVGLLPSNTPIGTGTFVLTYNGQSSPPAAIVVVANAFGIVAVNSGGTGSARVTTASYGDVFITQSATNRQVLILWGTGLGATVRDETQPAVMRDMTELDVKVYVGGKLAQVHYRGRTPTAAGLDQINFTVPDGVQGCSVSLVVVVNGVVSNWLSIPVAATANIACSDGGGLTPQEIEAANAKGSLSTATLSLSRSYAPDGPDSCDPSIVDLAGGSFARYNALGLFGAQSFSGSLTVGQCAVFQTTMSSNPGSGTTPVLPTYLDAGTSLTLNGPKGPKQLPAMQGQKGYYYAVLGGRCSPGYPADSPPYLDPGAYTLTGPGGPDVGPFTANLTVPPQLALPDPGGRIVIPRERGDLLITWTGGGTNGYVNITGDLVVPRQFPLMPLVAMFMCSAPVSAGQFTVPAVVLSSLPRVGVDPQGHLVVQLITEPARFTASGIDYGRIYYAYTTGKIAIWQ